MTNPQASDLFQTLKTYVNKLSEGEKSPQEIAAALNSWARESAESLKAKITEEVETHVAKMGFIKRDEFDRLAAQVAKLGGEKVSSKKSATSGARAKKTTVKKTAKKVTAKKTVAKKSAASRKAK